MKATDAGFAARNRLAREDEMATHVAAAGNVHAHCPLCGDSILSVNSRGRIISEDMHPIPLYTHGRHGEGYMVCDGCGFLAQLPGTLTVN